MHNMFNCEKCNPRLCSCPLSKEQREQANQLVLESSVWSKKEKIQMGIIKENKMEQIQAIECKCGMTEEWNADDPRNHSQTFIWIENNVQGAKYKCPCGLIVNSKILNKEEE